MAMRWPRLKNSATCKVASRNRNEDFASGEAGRGDRDGYLPRFSERTDETIGINLF
jgi:hypothetical protein